VELKYLLGYGLSESMDWKRHNKTVIAYYKAYFKISYFYFSSRIRGTSLRSASHFALSTFLKRGPPGKEAPLRFTTSKKVF